jgi:hypothetical protein
MDAQKAARSSDGPGRPAPGTVRWPIYVKKTTKEALERLAGTGYNAASKAAARLLDAIADTLPFE